VVKLFIELEYRREDEKVGILKKILSNDDDVLTDNISGDEYYDLKPEDALKENDGSTKMILLEPRAYSEAQQIADHLKMRNTVVVNLKRVTSDQAKRIIDFLAGTIYAISGDLQKIGGGIFLCTPNNINIQGKITEETQGKDIHDNDDINIEW
jgi:cell division inhibitor SepF